METWAQKVEKTKVHGHFRLDLWIPIIIFNCILLVHFTNFLLIPPHIVSNKVEDYFNQ